MSSNVFDKIKEDWYFSALPNNVKLSLARLCQIVQDQQSEIDTLKRQVARLLEAAPGEGERQPLPPNWIENLMAQDTRRAARHKRDFEEIAKLTGKTIKQVERDLCKRDRE